MTEVKTQKFMSPAPGRIFETMEVDLPDPRGFETMENARYLEIKRRETDVLNQSGAFQEV